MEVFLLLLGSNSSLECFLLISLKKKITEKSFLKWMAVQLGITFDFLKLKRNQKQQN